MKSHAYKSQSFRLLGWIRVSAVLFPEKCKQQRFGCEADCAPDFPPAWTIGLKDLKSIVSSNSERFLLNLSYCQPFSRESASLSFCTVWNPVHPFGTQTYVDNIVKFALAVVISPVVKLSPCGLWENMGEGR